MSCKHFFSYKDVLTLLINFVFPCNSMYCYVKCSVLHQKLQKKPTKNPSLVRVVRNAILLSLVTSNIIQYILKVSNITRVTFCW